MAPLSICAVFRDSLTSIKRGSAGRARRSATAAGLRRLNAGRPAVMDEQSAQRPRPFPHAACSPRRDGSRVRQFDLKSEPTGAMLPS